MAKRGRPTDYKDKYVEQARKLCALGATDKEIADFFEVATSTFYLWKAQHSEFSEALKAAKEIADERVVRSLYHRAVGYKHEAVKIFLPKDASEPVYAPYVEHVPPDTTAAIFWLKNRRSDEWRDKSHNEVTGADGAPLVPIINISGRPESSSSS